MASSSSQPPRGVWAAPPSEDAFFSLVDRRIHAGVLCRFARVVELSTLLAEKAEAKYEDDSLVVAEARITESEALNNMDIAARGTASGADQDALVRSWSALLSVVALLQRRLAANTLLPGTVRKTEVEYYVHVQAATHAARNKPLPPPAVVQRLASTIGYGVLLLDALYRSLNFLSLSFRSSWPDAQRRIVESFVREIFSS